MRTLYIVGITGMLGATLAQEAPRKGYLVKPFSFDKKITEDSVVVNCAGAIPSSKRQGSDMVEANALLPFRIAEACEDKVSKLIHISTDCVFKGSGNNPILATAEPNPIDLYGVTKALGEKIIWEYPNIPISIVRTSFIGFEHGLLKWFIKATKNKETVHGYANALWTGSTVWEVARGILEIIDKRESELVEHLSTERVWTKHDVLKRLNNLLDLDAKLEVSTTPRINRALQPTTVIRDLDNHFVAEELWEKYRS